MCILQMGENNVMEEQTSEVYSTFYLQKTSLSGSSKCTPETNIYKQYQFSKWLESADSKAIFLEKEKKIETQKKWTLLWRSKQQSKQFRWLRD